MPAKRPQKGNRSNVVPLNLQRAEPHPARLEAMQQWHHDQAARPDQAVAAIHISITQDGKIRTEGIAIEQAHAQAMLAAVPRLVQQLEHQAGLAHIKPPAPYLVQVPARLSRASRFNIRYHSTGVDPFAEVFEALKRAAS